VLQSALKAAIIFETVTLEAVCASRTPCHADWRPKVPYVLYAGWKLTLCNSLRARTISLAMNVLV
jgi:hypothetical protein